MRRKRDHQRQVKVEVSTSTLLALAQGAIELPEELQDPFFTSAIARRWVLDGERMNATIMASNFQSAVANSYSPDEINIWHETINADEILVLVLVLQILSRYLNLVEFLESEFTQVASIVLEMGEGPAAIKLLLELISPFAKLVDVFVHGRLLENEVRIKLLTNVRRENGVRESGDVGLGCRRQLHILSI
jgi:hypothetical protein